MFFFFAHHQFLTAMKISQRVMALELDHRSHWTDNNDPKPTRFSPENDDPSIEFTPFVSRHIVPPGTRLVFWGDVHGSFGSLMASMELLNQQGRIGDQLLVSDDSRFLFLGDFVDRGQRSVQVCQHNGIHHRHNFSG